MTDCGISCKGEQVIGMGMGGCVCGGHRGAAWRVGRDEGREITSLQR